MDAIRQPQSLSPSSDVDLARYPLHDAQARAALVRRAREELARDSCVVLPGFVSAQAAAAMADEARAATARAHRRENRLTAYAVNPAEGQDVPADHATRRLFQYGQHVIAQDLLPAEGRLLSLYRCDDLASLVADILDVPSLRRTADPLLSCTATSMAAGDQHGWHFDSNDFVVSLLLQAPEAGGEFEFAPYVRDEDDERYAEVEQVMAGDRSRVKVKAVEPGTLMIFCGRRALHRVTPVRGATPRLIGLFCFDRKEGMQFSDASRLRAVGRTQPLSNAA